MCVLDLPWIQSNNALSAALPSLQFSAIENPQKKKQQQKKNHKTNTCIKNSLIILPKR